MIRRTLFLNNSRCVCLFLSLVLSLLSLSSVTGLDNGLGLVPPMGWNSWNAFHCNIDESKIKSAAEIMISSLQQHGYKYLNLDDCWMSPNRTTTSGGEYQEDPNRFPSGMASLASYLHSNDLKFGLYTSAGTKTCQGLPGSLGYEQIDARTFASWGVDYLKYDNCYNTPKIPGIDRYTTMRNALNATGRPIFYSLCQWGGDNSWEWASGVGNMYRTTGDISPTWNSIRNNFWQSYRHINRAGKGQWLDPDMLEVGNGNLTFEESRSHFALWCFVKAPLLLGMDLLTLTEESRTIITNTNLIGINQDPAIPPATCFAQQCSKDDDWSVFVTSSSSSTFYVLIVNWKNLILELEVLIGQYFGINPMPNEVVQITNLYTNQIVGKYDFDAFKRIPIPTLQPHDSLAYQMKLVPKEEEEEGRVATL